MNKSCNNLRMANDKKLTGLNDAFLKNEGKLNEIDKDGISDDFSESSSFGNKRKKLRGGPAAKRRRKSRKIQEQETSEDDVEMKVEPRSTEEESSSNGKSTVVPAMSVEESIHLKEEPGVPKSPELKDDSFIEEVQQEEKPRSFIDDSLAKSSKSQEANKDEDQTDYSDDDTEQDEITTKANETRNEDETDYSDNIDYGSDEIEVVDAPLVKKHTASIELKDSPGESLEIKDSLADTLPVSTSAPKSTKKDGVETDYSDSDESDGSKASLHPKRRQA
ncbi:hypothetical protein Cantr_06769 [Candida viswanathii]|uniref:Uncharacterized protein n=1 Tax=Candida viswanathii TaxID=5486 RepID=A0A367XXG3_9ASCO|nr:hypothetical protein Cantr_06769 [Candida viswanathii]